MASRSRLRKLAFFLCSSVLLGIQCPPLAIDSVKTGVVTWVAGSFNTIDLTPFTDFIISSFTGGPTPLI
jgi:hypothetical protein